MRSPMMSSASSRRAARSGCTPSVLATVSTAGSGPVAAGPAPAASAIGAGSSPLAPSLLAPSLLAPSPAPSALASAASAGGAASPSLAGAASCGGGAASAGAAAAGAFLRAAAALRRRSGENSVSVFIALGCYYTDPKMTTPTGTCPRRRVRKLQSGRGAPRRRRRRDDNYAPPPTEPLASAETDTETETFAWMLIAALTAAATWPLMHSA